MSWSLSRPERPLSPDAQSAQPVTPKPQMDPDFYFESMLVAFRVEDYLFRVPAHRLVKESQFFKDLFELPQNDEDREGGSANKPIDINGVKCEDFRSLMKMLYPTYGQKMTLLSKSEWISVLELSSMWFFIDLREIAISNLDSLKPALTALEKIALGRKCGVSKWLLAGYQELVTKYATLNDEEVKALNDTDSDAAIKLFRIREGRLTSTYSYNHWAAEIKRIFADELNSVGKAFEKST